jgi:tryptophan synthase beta chain
MLFAKTEGILPAPETSHAIRCAIDEANKNDGSCIVFNLSGHGNFDLAAYDAFLSGKLEDYEYSEDKIKEAIAQIPKF